MLISKGKTSLLLLVSIIGTLLSFYLFQTVKNWENKKALSDFNELTGNLKNNLQKEIDREIEVLYSVESFYEGSRFVDSDEFKVFTQNALQRHPEIQSIEWVPYVKENELEKYQKEYWNNSSSSLKLFTYSAQGEKIPVSLKADYFPLTYSEPLEKNKSALGYDYGSNPTLLKAIEEARDTGGLVASSKVELHRTKDSHKNAIFIFLPLYTNVKTEDIEEKRKYLKGFVTLILKADLIFNDVFRGELPKFQIHLFCDPQKKPEDLLFKTGIIDSSNEDNIEKTETVSVANKTWVISFTEKYKNLATNTWESYAVLFSGLFVTFLLTYYLYFLLQQNTRIQTKVETQTKHLEEEIAYQKTLKENLKIFKRALESTQNGIIITDYRLKDNPIIYVNKAFENITGYSFQEAAGKNCRFLKAGDNPENILNKIREAIREKKTCHVILKNKKKDGSYFTNELLISPIFDENNTATHFVGIQQDITEKENIQNELMASNILQNTILNSANFTIISTDPTGIIKTFNKNAEKLLAYNASELVNKVTPEIMHDPREVIERAKALSLELGIEIKPGVEVFVAKAALGMPDENQWTYIRKDGSRFPVRLSVTALFTPTGVVMGYLGIGQDLTDEIKAKEKIDQYNHMIERFEKLSIGREMEIIELKRQINELKQRLGEKPLYKITQL